VVNDTGADVHGAAVRVTVEDAAGGVWRFETPGTLDVPAGGGGAFALSCPIPGAKPWSPETPWLYRLRAGILCRGAAGGDTDAAAGAAGGVTVIAGLRTIRFDPDHGFFLNGVKTVLKGVCVHEDSGCLGGAVWKDVWRRRLEKLKAMGCNALRMSHNPHGEKLYELCDELGFMVMDEAFDEWEGCKNKWRRGHNVYPPAHQGYYEDFPAWHEKDLAAMVVRGRNHPSVILWSIGNEIDYPNDPYAHPRFAETTGNNDANKPREERLYNADRPNMGRLAEVAARLVAITRRYDRARPVLTAAAFPELSADLGFLDALDVAGFNYRENLYDEFHRRFPRLPLLGSENSHALAAWKAVTDSEYVAGQFLWTGIDYLGEAPGWPWRGSAAGLLDTAGNEKIAYYRRRALWAAGSTPHLAARRVEAPGERPGRPGENRPDRGREINPWELSRGWDYLPGAAVTVVCYTGAPRGELLINGRSLGEAVRDDDREYLLWDGVPFEPGELRVVCAGGEDTLESTGAAAALAVSAWRPLREPSPFFPDSGKYEIAQIEIEVRDSRQKRCHGSSAEVFVSADGAGAKILGLENGDLPDTTEYARPSRRAHHGRLVAFALVERGAAEVTFTARSPGLAPASVTVGV